jgi:hypothetical protein
MSNNDLLDGIVVKKAAWRKKFNVDQSPRVLTDLGIEVDDALELAEQTEI